MDISSVIRPAVTALRTSAETLSRQKIRGQLLPSRAGSGLTQELEHEPRCSPSEEPAIELIPGNGGYGGFEEQIVSAGNDRGILRDAASCEEQDIDDRPDGIRLRYTPCGRTFRPLQHLFHALTQIVRRC